MAGFERNTANQKLVVYAFDVITGIGKTGDSGNITLYAKELGGTVVQITDTTAAELDATNAPGYYEFDLANTELDTAYTYFFPKSSTTSPNNVGVVAVHPFFTVPAGFSTTAMRGTDNALLASSAPTNFGDLAITVTTGEVLVDTTSVDAVADAVWNETMTGHSESGKAGAVIAALPEATAGGTGGLALYDNLFSIAETGTIADATPTTTSFTLSAGFSSTDDFYGGATPSNNSFIVVSSGSRRMTSVITDYVGSTRTVTLSPALPATPIDGDGVMILGLNV